MLKQFATFYINKNLFGIDVLMVREINKNMEITPVTPSPDFVVGLMNLRGQIVAITDLSVRLGIERNKEKQSNSCIVLKTNKELDHLKNEGLDVDETSKDIIGLLVDKIGDMVEVDTKEIEAPPANISGVDGKYLDGIIKLSGQLLITLKLSKILEIEQVSQ